MKPINKYLFITALTLFLGTELHAQLRVGGQASFLTLFGGTGVKTLGINASGEYAQSEKLSWVLGLGYYLPSKIEDEAYGYAMSSTTTPSQITVPVTYSFSFLNAYVGAKYYLIGEFDDDFAIFGLGEAGLLLAPVKTTVGSYDQEKYYTTIEDGAKETLGNPTIGLGAGAEFHLGPGFLFADLKLNIPAGSVNSRTGTEGIDIPTSFVIDAGYRISLD